MFTPLDPKNPTLSELEHMAGRTPLKAKPEYPAWAKQANPDTHCTTCGEVLSIYSHCWKCHYPPMDPAQDAAPAPQVDEAKLAQLNADVLHNLNNGPVWVEAGVSWVQRSRVVSVLEALTRGGSEVLARLRASEAKVRELTEQLTPGSMTERAPTQWAYEKSCAALEKHRQRADAAEAQVAKVYEVIDKEFDTHHRDSKSNCTPQQAQFYTNCEGAIAMLRMHLEAVVPEPKAAPNNG